MGFQVLTNCKTYLDEYDLTGVSNQVELKYSADILDKTTFNDTGKRRVGGLKNVEIDLQGFWEAGDGKIDALAEANLGVAGKIITLGPTGGAAGGPFYSFKNMLGEYQVGAAVGELLPFQYSGGGSSPEGLIRGTVLENVAKTATAAGAARNLGQVAAGKHLYAVMHILAVSGTNPTLDVKIQSDDAEGFLSPNDRITFAQATAAGGQWATRVAGAITDSWWRASWTIGGTDDPSFTVFVGVAIQ